MVTTWRCEKCNLRVTGLRLGENDPNVRKHKRLHEKEESKMSHRYVCLANTCSGRASEKEGLPERDVNAHNAQHLKEGESPPKWRTCRLPDPEGDDNFQTYGRNPDSQYGGDYDTNDSAAKIDYKAKSGSEPLHGRQTIQRGEST
jgi:hypothetical protein